MFLFIVQDSGVTHRWTHSNTSHVFIYQCSKMKFIKEWGFKYIPCFYLSAPVDSITTAGIYSNTSHVFIYRNDRPLCGKNFDEFKYIPCFYLSLISLLKPKWESDSNTSHVFIYPYTNIISYRKASYSNTSHVFIYHL